MRLQYGDVVVRASDADGVVCAKVEGQIDVSAAGRIIGDARRWAVSPLAQVVSYEAARVDMSAETLFQAAVRARHMDTPTALVVSADYLEMFRAYVRLHIDRGVHKAVFTSEARAREWAAQQAAVQGYWQRLMRSRRSSP